MEIQFHKNFEKKFIKLSARMKQKVMSAMKEFMDNPYSVKLHNHALSGRLLGKRAISAGGDMRIIFEEIDNYVLVIMLDIGSHNQVYR